MNNASHDLQKSVRLLAVFCIIAGFLLHFAFEWSKHSPIVALFAPINESVWEHEKLLFYPFFAGVWFFAYRKGITPWTFACIISAAAGLLLIPCAYYTYTGALGIQADWLNIVIFIIAVLFSCVLLYKKLEAAPPPAFLSALSGLLLLLLFLVFITFTFITPKLPLFQDPIDGTYGYQP